MSRDSVLVYANPLALLLRKKLSSSFPGGKHDLPDLDAHDCKRGLDFTTET